MNPELTKKIVKISIAVGISVASAVVNGMALKVLKDDVINPTVDDIVDQLTTEK